jgi:cyclase
MIKLYLLSLAFLVAAPVFASSETPEPEIEIAPLGSGVHILYGGNGLGSNVGVIETSEGLVLVDAMRDRTADKLRAALATISDDSVSHVFNTHRHEDHTSGNAGFVSGGAVLVRQASAPDGDEAEQIRFGDKLAMTVGGVRIEAYAVWSHTPDDALILLPEQNILFMGDTFTTNWHPTFYSGGEAGQLEVIEKALALGNERTLFVPGHGKASDRAGLLAYRDGFKAWMARARALAAAGADADVMEQDSELANIAARFLQDGSQDTIRPTSYRRFIERTISTELMPIDEAVMARLSDYAGRYQYEDGVALEVKVKGRALALYEDDVYAGRIIPLSTTRFHYPGALEGEGHMEFDLNDRGHPVSVSSVAGDARMRAKRVADEGW